jgi:2-succinyl-6-hydroxy-2,4-cyclohexadiene-1-carboxylate synthase
MSLLGVQRHGSGPIFVWLHGFTQTKDSAFLFRSILAGTNELLTVDLPGHGENSAIAASLPDTAALLAEVLPIEPFVLGGYSFGGRVALHFALAHPERARALVLVSATRGIEDPGDRHARRERDEVLAARIKTIGTDAFLDEWLAQPLFEGLANDPVERASRSRDANGLATSLRLAGTGTQEWLGPRLATLTMPVLTVAGARDEKFSLEASAIANAVPTGTASFIRDAGHAAHLERAHDTASAVGAFRDSL